jgi:hypothetical protein
MSLREIMSEMKNKPQETVARAKSYATKDMSKQEKFS